MIMNLELLNALVVYDNDRLLSAYYLYLICKICP